MAREAFLVAFVGWEEVKEFGVNACVVERAAEVLDALLMLDRLKDGGDELESMS